jgi:hypothetical protein
MAMQPGTFPLSGAPEAVKMMAPVWVAPASLPCTMQLAQALLELAHIEHSLADEPWAMQFERNPEICIEVHAPIISMTGVYGGRLLDCTLEGMQAPASMTAWLTPPELPLDPLELPVPPLLPVWIGPPELLPGPPEPVLSLLQPKKKAADVTAVRIDAVKSLF